jgi:hypothetical protein
MANGNAFLLGKATAFDTTGTIPGGTRLLVVAVPQLTTAITVNSISMTVDVTGTESATTLSIQHLVNPPTGAVTFSNACYWWAVRDSSGVVADTGSDVVPGDTTRSYAIDIRGDNLTFCAANDYFNDNLNITQAAYTQDYDVQSYGSHSYILGRYTGGTPQTNYTTTCTSVDDTDRFIFIGASYEYAFVDTTGVAFLSEYGII